MANTEYAHGSLSLQECLAPVVRVTAGTGSVVCQYDVVCFDEISGVSFDQKDGAHILKGYMESGEFSRGKESIRAEGGVERFVATPELRTDDAIDPDPLPPGQIWGMSPSGQEAGASLYRIEATAGPGSGVKILNAPILPSFRESARCAEQNLYARARELVGDRDPRAHEYTVQLCAMDNDRSGAALGLPTLLALCGSLLEKSAKGG